MRRFLLPSTAAALLAASGCVDSLTASRECTEVPTAIAETRGDTVVTVTGLRYIEIQAGTGAAAEVCRGVAVEFAGYLTDGSTFGTGTFSFVPGLDGAIQGFEEGVIGMRVSGTRRIIIPPELGYGSEPRYQEGNLVIPPNSTLVFDVELLAVE